MTILTDEILKLWADCEHAQTDNWALKFARAIESAVLEKLKQQEPVAWNYELENDAFRRAYTLGFKADTPLYAAPMPADGVVEQRDELLVALRGMLYANRCSDPAVISDAIDTAKRAIASVKESA